MAEPVSLALPVSLDNAAPILAGEDASTTTPPAACESAGTPPIAAVTSSDNEYATAASAFGTTTDDETPTREDRSESGVDASGEENAVSSPDVASSDDGEKSPSGPSVVISAPQQQQRASAVVDPNAEVGGLVCKGDRHSEVEPFRGTLLPSHLTASHSVGCFSPQTAASSDPQADGGEVETENSAGNNNNNNHHHRLSHLRHHHRGGGAGTGSSSAQDLTMMTGSMAATSNGVIEGLELSAKLRESMFTVDKINFDEPLIDPGEKYKDLLYPADEGDDDDGIGDGVTVLTCDDNPNLEATALLKNSNSKVTVTISPEGLRWVQHSVPVIPSGLKVAESSGALLKVRFVDLFLFSAFLFHGIICY